MMRKISKLLEYIIIRFFVFIFNLFPFSIKKKLFTGLLRFLALLLPKLKKRLVQNISTAFPEKKEVWVEELSRQSVDFLGTFMAEFTEVTKITPSFCKRYSGETSSITELKKVFQEGAIVILGHFGNWELHGALSCFITELPIHVMAKRQSNPWSNRWIEKIRLRANIKTIYTDESPKDIIRKIREEKIFIALLADQDAGKNGLLVDFMGKTTPTFRGPAFLARKTGVDVYFGYSRHNSGKLDFFIEKMKLPDFDPKSDPAAWDLEFTQTWSARLEEEIRKKPDEYFWAHNRWKNAPEGDS